MVSFFFFSSRRRHTRLQGDWSSDVCSSDLEWGAAADLAVSAYSYSAAAGSRPAAEASAYAQGVADRACGACRRSEERRVGKECRVRWWGCEGKEKCSVESRRRSWSGRV